VQGSSSVFQLNICASKSASSPSAKPLSLSVETPYIKSHLEIE
jgi:hypothetical protein